MKRYKLLTENDLLPNHRYLAIVYYPYPSLNRNAMTEFVYFDEHRQWYGTRNDIVSIVDESVIDVMIEENPQRAYEIMEGGFVEDGRYTKLLKSYDFHLIEKMNDLIGDLIREDIEDFFQEARNCGKE